MGEGRREGLGREEREETYAEAPGAQLRKYNPARRRDEDYHDDGDDDPASRVHHFRGPLPSSTQMRLVRSRWESDQSTAPRCRKLVAQFAPARLPSRRPVNAQPE